MRRRSLSLSLVLAAALLAGASLAAPPASSAPPTPVQVENAWIPQPPPGSEVAAAYFTLRNTGDAPIVLVGVSSPVASEAMLHRTLVMNGESMMRPVASLTVAPGRSITLEPGALHVMLDGLRKPLQVGESVALVLHLASGEAIHVSARVRPLGSE